MLIAGLIAVAIVAIGTAVVWVAVAEPSLAGPSRDHDVASVDPGRLEAHVRMLAETLGPRDFTHQDGLDRVADYIHHELESLGAQVTRQLYPAGTSTYANVVAVMGPDTPERIVVGAHYDSAGPLPAADDNASGVAGLIELARALSQRALATRIELVAYCLEEPPFFRTESMGSAVHAKSLREQGVSVRAMLALEMLGYFSDESGSQRYPAPFLRPFYPSVGNFIGVVSTFGQDGLGGRVKRSIRAVTDLPAYSITAWKQIPGIDFSDHLNYWNHDYPAVMITDTSFYRNANYHTERDTPETLDYERMAEVVRGVVNAVLELDGDTAGQK